MDCLASSAGCGLALRSGTTLKVGARGQIPQGALQRLECHLFFAVLSFKSEIRSYLLRAREERTEIRGKCRKARLPERMWLSCGRRSLAKHKVMAGQGL